MSGHEIVIACTAVIAGILFSINRKLERLIKIFKED